MNQQLFKMLRYIKYQTKRFSKCLFRRIYNYQTNDFIEIVIKGKHVYCGYYDINPFSSDDSKILIHVASKDLKIIDIAYFDIRDKKIYYLSTSNVTSWQMGSRIRWFDDGSVFFNDFIDLHYCSRIVNTSGNTIKVFRQPFYEISKEKNIGISVDFFLLHLLRAGYGYSNYTESLVEYYPKSKHTIEIIELSTEKTKSEITLSTLLQQYPIEDHENYYHYFNHICLSPSHNYFTFFHLWVSKQEKYSKNRLFISDINGKILFMLENTNRVSHYTWKNDYTLLITTYIGRHCIYRKYVFDYVKSKFVFIDFPRPISDGHPTYLSNDLFISDTYPDKEGFQTLFIYDEKHDRINKLAKFFSNPLYFNERRCDLHPKANTNHTLISFDTHFRKFRSTMIVRHDNKEE